MVLNGQGVALHIMSYTAFFERRLTLAKFKGYEILAFQGKITVLIF